MESVKTWAFSVCCASIVGGMMDILLPEGSLQKTYKTVFCVFILCVILAPLSEIGSFDIDIFKNELEDIENEEYSENVFNENSEKYIKDEIVSSVKEILKEEGVNAEDTFVKVNILNDGSINIIKFTLTFSKMEDADLLAEKIYEKTGIKPEIQISGEN